MRMNRVASSVTGLLVAWSIPAMIAAAPAADPAAEKPATRPARAVREAPAANRDHWKVPELPGDNLLKNAWFSDALKHWESDGNWGGETTKWGNPSTSEKPGTAGRISTGRRADSDIGKTVDVGKDAYLYQVVAADPAKTTLKFDMYWVCHTIDPAEVTVYAGPSDKGPWTQVWKPFHQVRTKAVRPEAGRSGNTLWRRESDSTDLVTTTLKEGHPFYKVEFHVRLPDKSGGFKFTGVYFTATADAPAAEKPLPQKETR